MQIQDVPFLGGAAPRNAHRTAGKLSGFALRFRGETRGPAARYLDVGCGNGFITELVAPSFAETFAIDVEELRLRDFHAHVRNAPGFRLFRMSAAQMAFPDELFSFITCFEVLEHVRDVSATVREIVRVCQRFGVIVISVPQVWFPVENHGMKIGGHIFPRKIPGLPYLRPLHRKLAIARVFSSAGLDRLFLPLGTELLATAYAAPQFERAASHPGSWESRLAFLRGFLGRCEQIPVLRALTGVSLLKAYRKVL